MSQWQRMKRRNTNKDLDTRLFRTLKRMVLTSVSWSHLISQSHIWINKNNEVVASHGMIHGLSLHDTTHCKLYIYHYSITINGLKWWMRYSPGCEASSARRIWLRLNLLQLRGSWYFSSLYKMELNSLCGFLFKFRAIGVIFQILFWQIQSQKSVIRDCFYLSFFRWLDREWMPDSYFWIILKVFFFFFFRLSC